MIPNMINTCVLQVNHPKQMFPWLLLAQQIKAAAKGSPSHQGESAYVNDSAILNDKNHLTIQVFFIHCQDQIKYEDLNFCVKNKYS